MRDAGWGRPHTATKRLRNDGGSRERDTRHRSNPRGHRAEPAERNPTDGGQRFRVPRPDDLLRFGEPRCSLSQVRTRESDRARRRGDVVFRASTLTWCVLLMLTADGDRALQQVRGWSGALRPVQAGGCCCCCYRQGTAVGRMCTDDVGPFSTCMSSSGTRNHPLAPICSMVSRATWRKRSASPMRIQRRSPRYSPRSSTSSAVRSSLPTSARTSLRFATT